MLTSILVAGSALIVPISGAAQTSPPDGLVGPFIAAPLLPEAPEGDPNTCFSNYTGGASADFSSSDAQAVRSAIAAASSGGTVKLAGTCAGAVPQAGTNQVALITKTLLVQGGYAETNWTASYPITQPTVLDAQGGGRVLQITGVPVSIANLIAQNGMVVSAAGGGIASNSALVLTNVTVLSSTATGDGGGVLAGGALRLIDTRLISNTSGQSGGGASSSGLLTLIGGLFERNVSQHGGGARGLGSVVMTGTVFLTNSASLATFSGGGLKVDGASTLNGGLFQGNTGYDGGGLSGGGTASITGTQFISNTAARWGGGANVNLLTQITSTFFANNVSGSDCGALRVASILRATASAFYTNTTISNGGAACADAGAVVAAGIFQNNASAKGGGLWTNGSTALSNTAFVSNTATDGGGGAYLQGGVATLNGGVFQANRATNLSVGNAGGLYAASLSMTGTLLISNTAAQKGGGVYAEGPATLRGAQFTGNQAQDAAAGNGGGLYANAALTATGTQFENNIAGYGGGGAFVAGPASVVGSDFRVNSAQFGGGARFNGNAIVTGTSFSRNTATYTGGGVWFSGDATVNEVTFSGNAATNYSGGGALFASGIVMSGTLFAGNTAVYGGGSYFNGNANVMNTVYRGNTSEYGGGAHFSGATPKTLINILFARNQASNKGSAIYVEEAAALSLIHATIVSPTLVSNQAIMVEGGVVFITNTIVASHTFGIKQTTGTVQEDYTYFFGNTTNKAGAMSGGSHDIATGAPGFIDPSVDNYHLLSGSGAINAGANAGVLSDVDGQVRPLGGGFDIGYDETAFAPSLSALNDSPTMIGNITGLSSTLVNGGNFTYTWSFGDGIVLGAGASTPHTYAVWGAMTATVTATNGISTVVAKTVVVVVPYRTFVPLAIRGP